jgi:hypothetical protein
MASKNKVRLILTKWRVSCGNLPLVDWTARIIRSGKRGHIENKLPPILERLQIEQNQRHINTTQFEVTHRNRFSRLPPTLDTE